ncbi:MAG: helix-turn-helix domain-containing protein [Bacteroides sp.]|nr:helix-turn-helix domain-containing protein [Bacteroides sp.]MCM1085185.1 helix-turn-helix domain-containing protein [Bacteroides sp.]MCM1170065.1 helix-turn-helix domain-containing protein [Bacteroides sp.]MCM1555861.1 helix-turn-helix domain-containing protein [Bacteroides sp.]
MEDLKKTIGHRLQMLRLERNLTQEQMGEKLNLSTSAYCKIEYGETDLTLTRLNKIAEVLNMSEMDLFSRIEGQACINEPHDCDCVWIAKDSSTVTVESAKDLRELVRTQTLLLESLSKRLDAIEKKISKK